MAFIPVANTWEIRVEQAFAGRIAPINVYHLKRGAAGALTQANTDAISGAIGGAYTSSGIKAFLSTGWTMSSITVTDLTTQNSPSFVAASAVGVGTDAGQVLPGQTCGLIEWKTALRGRSYTGRTFHSGFTEGDSDGLPSAGCVTAMQDFGDDLIAGLTDYPVAGSGLAVVSRYSGKIPNPNPGGNRRYVPSPRANGIATLITLAAASPRWKTQRRRAFPL